MNLLCLFLGSRKILKSTNAGGNSIYSEAASCQILESILNCKLKKTEMEIQYYPLGGSITDYIISAESQAGNESIGVSVTRAMKFRGIFTPKDAAQLLTKKLQGSFS